MRRLTLCLLLLLASLVSACGSDASAPTDAAGAAGDAGAADAGRSAADAAGDATDTTGRPDTGHDPALCDTIWDRLASCGHVYTFPSFPEDCAGWLRDGDGDRLDELERCAVYACARLVTCVEDL